MKCQHKQKGFVWNPSEEEGGHCKSTSILTAETYGSNGESHTVGSIFSSVSSQKNSGPDLSVILELSQVLAPWIEVESKANLKTRHHDSHQLIINCTTVINSRYLIQFVFFLSKYSITDCFV